MTKESGNEELIRVLKKASARERSLLASLVGAGGSSPDEIVAGFGGGRNIVDVLFGFSPPYSTVVFDLARKLSVGRDSYRHIEEVEVDIARKIVLDTFHDLDANSKSVLATALRTTNTKLAIRVGSSALLTDETKELSQVALNLILDGKASVEQYQLMERLGVIVTGFGKREVTAMANAALGFFDAKYRKHAAGVMYVLFLRCDHGLMQPEEE